MFKNNGLFNRLEDAARKDHLPGRISGGEMQMVAIARALLGSPGLVLFYEPSQGLAPKVVRDVVSLIGRLKAEGVAALLVEQNAPTALAIADRVYVMRAGEVVEEGDVLGDAHRLVDLRLDGEGRVVEGAGMVNGAVAPHGCRGHSGGQDLLRELPDRLAVHGRSLSGFRERPGAVEPAGASRYATPRP